MNAARYRHCARSKDGTVRALKVRRSRNKQLCNVERQLHSDERCCSKPVIAVDAMSENGPHAMANHPQSAVRAWHRWGLRAVHLLRAFDLRALPWLPAAVLIEHGCSSPDDHC